MANVQVKANGINQGFTNAGNAYRFQAVFTTKTSYTPLVGKEAI